MKARCTKDSSHKEFITTILVKLCGLIVMPADVRVDEHGTVEKVLGSLCKKAKDVQLLTEPSREYEWTCTVCGADAKVED